MVEEQAQSFEEQSKPYPLELWKQETNFPRLEETLDRED